MAPYESTTTLPRQDTASPRRQHGGRKRKLTRAQEDLVLRQLTDLTTNVTELAEALGVNRSTIYRTRLRRGQ